MTSATEVKPDLAPADTGDHDRFSHYVRKTDIAKAAVEGVPVRAICGKVWVPIRDGERFPACPECKDLYENVMKP